MAQSKFQERVTKPFAIHPVFQNSRLLPIRPIAVGLMALCLGVNSFAAIWADTPQSNTDTSLHHFNQARNFERDGQWDKADAELRQAIFRNPNDYMNYVRLASLLARFGKTNEAISNYQKAISLNPADPMLHFSLGALYESLGQYESAKREYTSGVQHNPEYVYGKYNLAKVLMQLSEYPAAETVFQQFLARYPNHYEAQRYLANVYLVDKKPDQAAQVYETLKINFPDRFSDSINLARALTQAEAPERALDELKNAYAKEGNKADILEEMGNAHLALGQDAYGIHNYEQSYHLDKTRYPLLLKVADGYQKTQKNEQAAQKLQEYLSIEPDNANVKHWYANLLVQQKQYNKAFTELNQLLDKTEEPKERYQLNKEIAYVLQSKGDLDYAIQRYETLLQEPEAQLDAQLKTNLAIAYHKSGQLDKAVPLYEAVYLQAPAATEADREQKQTLGNDLANVLTTLGDQAYQQQQYDASLNYYSRATQYARPDNALPLVGLGNAHFALKQLDLAQSAYLHALQKDPNNVLAGLYLGKVELQRQDPQQAVRQLEYVVSLNERQPLENGLLRETLLTLGDAYQQAGKPKDAAETYEKAQAIVLPVTAQTPASKEQQISLLLTQGNLWQQLDNLDKAKLAYEQVLTQDPNNAKAHYNLGIVYNELGQLEQSASAYQQALKADPAFNESRYGLAVTYEKQQKYNEAMQTYQAYVKAPDALYGPQAQERIQLLQQALSTPAPQPATKTAPIKKTQPKKS